MNKQMPGVLERYQRRTARLTRQARAVVKELAGRAGSRLPAIPAVGLSRHTALRTLLRIPLPTGRLPRVIGVGDFALRRQHRYATVVIDPGTHERIARRLHGGAGFTLLRHRILLYKHYPPSPEQCSDPVVRLGRAYLPE